jgi:hypothetical protein
MKFKLTMPPAAEHAGEGLWPISNQVVGRMSLMTNAQMMLI